MPRCTLPHLASQCPETAQKATPPDSERQSLLAGHSVLSLAEYHFPGAL